MDYVINFMILILIYFIIYTERWSELSTKALFCHTTMYIYIVMVLYVTLMPFSIPVEFPKNLSMGTANFIPFRDLFLNYGGAEREIILNMIMMMPFGFLYPLIKRTGLFKIVALTFLFSLLIEVSQLIGTWSGSLYPRSFDVTDLITNTIGGLIGYLIYMSLKPIVKRIFTK